MKLTMRVEIGNKKKFTSVLNKLFPKNNFFKINGFSIDSRLVKKDDIYLPLMGKNVNGHSYITDSISNGASIIFSEQLLKNIDKEIIYVDSTKDILNKLAYEYRKSIECPIIGITGSNGKTTTKEMLNHILSKSNKITSTQGNYNSSIGLPISIFTIQGDEKICILEMGASKPNEISELCKIANPSMGLITNISASHIENFKTLDQIALTKSSLLLDLPKNGIAFINKDDKHISKFPIKAKKIYYSMLSKANYYGEYADGRLIINESEFSFPCSTKIMAQNILASYSVAHTLGISSKEIRSALNTYKALSGRGNIVIYNKITIINDTYNSNLESAKAGIDMLKNYKGKRKIAIIGDMLELGTFSEKHHKLLGEYISKSNIDTLFAIGELSELTVKAAKNSNAKFFKNKNELIKTLKKTIKEGDVLYLKGSRGMEMETIITNGEFN